MTEILLYHKIVRKFFGKKDGVIAYVFNLNRNFFFRTTILFLLMIIYFILFFVTYVAVILRAKLKFKSPMIAARYIRKLAIVCRGLVETRILKNSANKMLSFSVLKNRTNPKRLISNFLILAPANETFVWAFFTRSYHRKFMKIPRRESCEFFVRS